LLKVFNIAVIYVNVSTDSKSIMYIYV